MGKTWKVLIGLAVALPMLAYVAGSLAASEPQDSRHSPVILEPAPTDASGSPDDKAPQGKKGNKSGQKPKPAPPPRTTPPRTDDDDDDGPRVVRPRPDDLDDDSDDRGRDRDDDDDDDDDGDDDD